MSADELFKDELKGYWTYYDVQARFKNLVVGGVPSTPSVIRKWLEARLNAGDARLEEILAETLAARTTAPTVKDQIDSLMNSDASPSINGFKRNDAGVLCLEGRCVKAMLKESMNSAFPGIDFPGKSDNMDSRVRKGLMKIGEEYVMVDPDLIELGVKASEIYPEPSDDENIKFEAWVEERVKHVKTPQGDRSAIARVEVVYRPTINFVVKVRRNFMDREVWAKVWSTGEEIGLGADRGRGDGRFELLAFDKRPEPAAKKK